MEIQCFTDLKNTHVNINKIWGGEQCITEYKNINHIYIYNKFQYAVFMFQGVTSQQGQHYNQILTLQEVQDCNNKFYIRSTQKPKILEAKSSTHNTIHLNEHWYVVHVMHLCKKHVKISYHLNLSWETDLLSYKVLCLLYAREKRNISKSLNLVKALLAKTKKLIKRTLRGN